MKKQISSNVIIAGILALAAIEITALYKGIDGVLLSTIVALIAGAIGITIPSPFKFK